MLKLFGNKGFSPKKSTPRKASSLSNLASLDVSQRAQEFGIDYQNASLKLNGTEFKFEDGVWQADSAAAGGVPHREMVLLKKENQRIQEENNMLKLKLDVLLDMLTESTVESQILQKERDHARAARHR